MDWNLYFFLQAYVMILLSQTTGGFINKEDEIGLHDNSNSGFLKSASIDVLIILRYGRLACVLEAIQQHPWVSTQ